MSLGIESMVLLLALLALRPVLVFGKLLDASYTAFPPIRSEIHFIHKSLSSAVLAAYIDIHIYIWFIISTL